MNTLLNNLFESKHLYKTTIILIWLLYYNLKLLQYNNNTRHLK